MIPGVTPHPVDGRFQLIEQLGGGGMGLVWRAYDLALHREVALKEVRSPATDFAADPAAEEISRQRVLREARALARLTHPNVVTIHHIVDSPELRHPWLVMELVTGGSLDGVLKREGTIAPGRAARIGRGIAAALNAAQAAGIEHRDVKPANVLLRPDGTPVLTDFGIAALRDTTSLTVTGTVIGSPEYMAPERIRGAEGDPASDLWSLGMLLYVAVEGYHPLRRETSIATLAAVLDQPIPPPARAGALARVIGALLQREPSARPSGYTAERMLAEVEQGLSWTSGPFPAAPFPGPTQHPSAPFPSDHFPAAPADARSPRHRLRFAGAVAGVAATGLVGAIVWSAHAGTGTPQADSESTRSTSPTGKASQADTAATATAGSAPSSGTGSGGATDLFAASALGPMVSAMEPVMGGSKVLELVVFQDYAIADTPLTSNPQLYDEYMYKGGGASKWSDGGSVSDFTGSETVDLKTVNWSIVPALMKKAASVLGVSDPTERYVVVNPNIPTDKGAAMVVYLKNGYGTGYLVADQQGHVVATYPLGS